MQTGAIVTGVAGIVWLRLIIAAGRLARRNRNVLLHVFRPGLYFTNVFLVLLIAAHSILAVAAIYLGEVALIGRVHGGVIVAIGLGALFGVLTIARVSFSTVRWASAHVVGTPTSPEKSPALWDFVRRLSQTIRVTPPDHSVVGLDPNFFVTEAVVLTLDKKLRGRTLFMSLPLSRILDVEELKAIIGHELGHFSGQDTAFSRKFYPIYRGTLDSLHGLEASGGDGAAGVALLPAVVTISFFLDAFAAAESEISRERELVADKIGAQVSDPATAAVALAKVHAFSRQWETIQAIMARGIRRGELIENVSATFARFVSDGATAKALEGIGRQQLSHPTDSHPPLLPRLQNLGVELDRVEGRVLAVAPETPAISLVADHETLERLLTSVEYQRIVQSLERQRTLNEAGVLDKAPSSRMDPIGVPAEVRCWSCNRRLVVSEQTRGRTVKCPRCGTKQQLPRS